LANASLNKKELFWHRAEYRKHLEHHSRASKITWHTALRLENARQELKEINRKVSELERDRRNKIIPLTVVLALIMFTGVAYLLTEPTITGMAIFAGVEEINGLTLEPVGLEKVDSVNDSLSILAKESFDCSEFIETGSGRYYCVDNEKFYQCKGFEYLADLPDGDMIRCIDAKESNEKVSKEDCPFKHMDCNVTVDIDKGWGKAQSAVKSEYKLSAFHENFYCAKGHCEIPFYFKSNISLEGNLTFNAAAELELRNISVERVLQDGVKEKDGKTVSMQKDDSDYYLLYFDYTPEWTSETGIRIIKPLKFNITASLNDEKILELDPIAYVNNPGSSVDTDCDAP
ncbi:MAG: hypothetical protein AABX05_02075, partial [Nanoarchaeota archaeon]